MEVLINGKHHTHTDNPVTAYDVCGNPHTIKPIDYHLYNFTSFTKLIIDGVEISPEGEEGMERLTYWNEEYGCWSYKCASGDAAKRLAAYEDTGLTPEQIKAQQQEIARIKRQLNCERQTVSMLKSFGLHYGEFPRLEADKLIDKLVADKDEQAGRIMRMDYLLRRTLPILEATNNQQELIEAIDALLGGKEDV